MNFELARPHRDAPMLLYSLAEFREIIFDAMAVADVRTVVEIGSEAGLFTRELARWVTERTGELVSIDPAPGDAVRRLAAETRGMTLIEETSHVALRNLDSKGAYLIDGDHNYYTVLGELEAIHAANDADSRFPLIVLQDVGWPCGSRDTYYLPDTLPSEAVHAYVFSGVVPWSAETVTTGGFRGNGEFAVARHEGGPKNGVRDALEDFLSKNMGYRVISLPCIFGLAFVFPSAAPWADELSALLGPFDDHPLLARLEANRILLYLKVLDLQDRSAEEKRQAASAISKLENELNDARTRLAVIEQAARETNETGEEIRSHSAVPSSGQGVTAGPGRGLFSRMVQRLNGQ